MTDKRHLLMPLKKKNNSRLEFVGILSDDSIDRDDEIMSPELLKSWAVNTTSIPLLFDHDNEMKSLAGVIKNLKVVKGVNKGSGLVGDVTILKSNPHTSWISDTIGEMEDAGLNVGLSISAIPHDWEDGNVEKDGYSRKWTKAELLEATLTPIPSNRNAYAMVAKSFDISSETVLSSKNYSEEKNMSEEKKKPEEQPEEEVKEEIKENKVEEKSFDISKIEELINKKVEERVNSIKKEEKSYDRKAELSSIKEETVSKDVPSFEIKKEYGLADMLKVGR